MKVKVTVNSKLNSYEIICLIHSSNDQHSRKLDMDYYRNDGKNKRIPVGKHHEIEILSPDPAAFPHYNKLHIEYSQEKKPFVCNIWPMPTIEHTLKILKMWAAGTVYTLETGKGFQLLFLDNEAENENFSRVLQLLKNKHSIAASIETVE